MSPLTNLQPQKVPNCTQLSGNPLKVLELCLKIPAEVLLTMLILSTVVFNLLWRFPFRKRSMNQGQRRKEDTGRRTHSCMEKHTLHAILRRCGLEGTGGDWRGLELLCPLCILPLTPPGTSSLVLLKDKAVKTVASH